MLMIRKIIQEDRYSFHKFCTQAGTKEALAGPDIYWGAFDNKELMGYVKIEFRTLKIPLIDDLQTKCTTESSVVEGLLRGAIHYCSTEKYDTVGVRNMDWLSAYLKSALDVIEKKSYNNVYYYEINIMSFFDKPCKGRSMCP